MVVTLGSTRYGINYFYTETDHKQTHKRHKVTGCIISRIVPGAENEDVAYGESVCHSVDTFVKASGRKIALARALSATIPNAADPSGEWVRPFTKEERATIWNEYFKTTAGFIGKTRVTINVATLREVLTNFGKDNQVNLDSEAAVNTLITNITAAGKVSGL